MEQYSGTSNAWKHFLKASIYREMKNSEAAVVQAEKCTEILHRADPSDLIYQRDYYAVMLAENNQIEEAYEVARALKADIEKGDEVNKQRYWLSMSGIEMVQGNTEAAATFLEKASAEPSSFPFMVGVNLGRSYLELGRLGEAVSELEKALSRYNEVRAITAIEAVTAHHDLGLAYEKSGWTNKAIEQYEEFLDIWKDADPGIEEIDDAKERLAHLKSGAS
jgi:tetratricopeptide (TPR) repeat protein